MNEWKEFNLNKIEHEFEIQFTRDEMSEGTKSVKIRYRKIQPDTITHKEIMEHRYWMFNDGVWRCIINYTGYGIAPYRFIVNDHEYSVNKKWFTNRKSTDIPPEFPCTI